MAVYLYVCAEQYVDGWRLIDPATISRSESGDHWIYRRRTLIALATGMPSPQFVDPVEPFGVVGTVPDDLSQDAREISTRRYNFTGAPSGHVVLTDLLEFDWDRTAVMQGRVPSEHASRFEAGQPFPKDLAEVPGLLQLPQPADRGVLVRWTDTYRELAGDEFLATINQLDTVYGDTAVRLVYWAG